jgi:hypothetical protein
MTAIETCIRNLTRSFLTCSHVTGKRPSEEERADTEQAVRLLLALICAAKNHLRAEWGVNAMPFLLLPKSAGDVERRHRRESTSVHQPEYEDLLPSGIRGFEDQGLGLLLQLSIRIESYIKRGHDRGWFHSPQASQMTVQLNELVKAYGSMETIHLTPLPVAYLIHMASIPRFTACCAPCETTRDSSTIADVVSHKTAPGTRSFHWRLAFRPSRRDGLVHGLDGRPGLLHAIWSVLSQLNGNTTRERANICQGLMPLAPKYVNLRRRNVDPGDSGPVLSPWFC